MKENPKAALSTKFAPEFIDPNTYIKYEGIIAFKTDVKSEKAKRSEIKPKSSTTTPVKWFNLP